MACDSQNAAAYCPMPTVPKLCMCNPATAARMRCSEASFCSGPDGCAAGAGDCDPPQPSEAMVASLGAPSSASCLSRCCTPALLWSAASMAAYRLHGLALLHVMLHTRS